MLRKGSKAVPEGTGPVPQQEESGSHQPTLVDIYQRIEEVWGIKIDEISRRLGQHLTSLEQDARQPRLAMKADGQANTKACERTEDAATAVQAMHRDTCSATRVSPCPKTNSTSFGAKVEPPAPPCRNDVLVENSAAAPKSCLPSLEMRSPIAAGGLLSTGETSTTTKITFNRPPLWLHQSERNLRTSSQPVSYYSSFYNLFAALSCRWVTETKSM